MTVIYFRNSSHFCQKYGKWFSVARIALLCIHICGLSRKVNTNKIKLTARCDLFRFSFIAQIIVFLCSELRNIEFLVIKLCSSNFRSSIFLLMRLIYQNNVRTLVEIYWHHRIYFFFSFLSISTRGSV